jgi:acrylyl-CoA reductase (NADPH)
MLDSLEFRALRIKEVNGTYQKSIDTCFGSELPQNDVLIKVEYAGLNYKDALSSTGHKGITREFPHTPGVDAAGVVVFDRTGKYSEGDEVICTSFDLGMNTWGGFSEYISVPAHWVVPLPKGISLQESMLLGTAAFTAGLALWKMENCGQNPGMGPIVVTGASGGVGSMAVALLAKAGYQVIASSGKKEEYDYLYSIGADTCVGREFTNDRSGRPLLKPKWAGAIDNIGGNTLVTLLKSCNKEGCVASIGLVDSPDFSMTVYPFILNGINLLGVDSAETAFELRSKIWHKLANEWASENYQLAQRLVSLEEIPEEMDKMLRSESRGRVVAKL